MATAVKMRYVVQERAHAGGYRYFAVVDTQLRETIACYETEATANAVARLRNGERWRWRQCQG
jgi:hypothetical protein